MQQRTSTTTLPARLRFKSQPCYLAADHCPGTCWIDDLPRGHWAPVPPKNHMEMRATVSGALIANSHSPLKGSNYLFSLHPDSWSLARRPTNAWLMGCSHLGLCILTDRLKDRGTVITVGTAAVAVPMALTSQASS